MKNILKLASLAVLMSLPACAKEPSSLADSERTVAPEDRSFEATGDVANISDDVVTISHGPVPEIGWPAMTMGFETQDAAPIADIAVGDRVRFVFSETDTGYALDSIVKPDS